MDIGNQFYALVIGILQPIGLAFIAFMGVRFFASKELSKLAQFVAVAVIGVVFLFNPGGIKDFLLKLANGLIGG